MTKWEEDADSGNWNSGSWDSWNKREETDVTAVQEETDVTAVQEEGDKSSKSRSAGFWTECRGTIRAYNLTTGWGFAVSPDIEGDIFVHCSETGGFALSPGVSVTFKVVYDKERRPQARDVKMEQHPSASSSAIVAVSSPQADAEDDDALQLSTVPACSDAKVVPEGMFKTVYEGKIKSYSLESGYGFIACEETHKVFNRDVFLHKNQMLTDSGIGDTVRFRIVVDMKSQPKGVRLEVVQKADDPALPPPVAVTGPAPGPARPAGGPAPGPAPLPPPGPPPGRPPCTQPSSTEASANGFGRLKDCMINEAGSGTNSAAPAQQAWDSDMKAWADPDQRAREERPDAAATAPPPAAMATVSGQASEWKKFSLPDGNGFWWWRESDNSHFTESNPGPWQKYVDPHSGKCYWWREDTEELFWAT